MPVVMEKSDVLKSVADDFIDDAVEDVEAAWDAESDRRLQEVLDGTAQLVTGESSMRRLDAMLAAIG